MMDEDTRAALADLNKRVDEWEEAQNALDKRLVAMDARLDAMSQDIGAAVNRLQDAHTQVMDLATAPAGVGVQGAAEVGSFVAGLDRLAVRTIAEARAVLDEYYTPFLHKVRGELGLPPVEPAPVAAPATMLSSPQA